MFSLRFPLFKAVTGVRHPETDADFDAVLEKAEGNLVVIDFSATWCPPCRMIAPIFEKLSKSYESVIFVKVDVDITPEVAQKYRVLSMPTFVFIKNGQEIGRFSGANSQKLEEMINTNK